MFVFRLALHLGMTVKELLDRVDSAELTEWEAYYHLEPFGEDRGDYRAGVIASTMANIYRSEKSKPFTPQDFMPFSDKDRHG